MTVGILGAGDIGTCIAKHCKGLGMTVWGMVRRSLPQTTKLPYLDQHRDGKGLTEILQKCDVICNVLPSTPATQGLLSEDTFQHCEKKKPLFINIGRGNVTTESSLVKALNNGWISGAVLDVFEEEPLPKDSLLWDMPNVTITPHCSGETYPYMVSIIIIS